MSRTDLMETRFFERPILNSPYEYPSQYWEFDETDQPTSRVVDRRRHVWFITPIPRPKEQEQRQQTIVFDAPAKAFESDVQQYDLTVFIRNVCHRVDRWCELPAPAAWRVRPRLGLAGRCLSRGACG